MSYTSNFDLIKMAQKYGIKLIGVFMKDQLPKKKEYGGYIINLQDSIDGNGTHWVAVFLSKKGPVYFDSFGIDPPIAIVKWIGSMGTLLINQKEIQNIASGYCGQYSLFFIKYLQDHENDRVPLKVVFKNFLKLWDANPEENLTHLKEIIKRSLSLS